MGFIVHCVKNGSAVKRILSNDECYYIIYVLCMSKMHQYDTDILEYLWYSTIMKDLVSNFVDLIIIMISL